MIGGFLGAGKTTALARLAKHYIEQGQRVGLVTNDQAYDLVDTRSLRAQGFHVGEVPGACFCCKFSDLVDTVAQLAAEEQPDILLAEPVGSCTDLMATVIEPLRALHGDEYEIGPLAVLLKPEHGRKILREEKGVGFSPQAAYIFLKQIEEADIVAINKIDKLTAEERSELVNLVGRRFPGKQVCAVSATTGEGFESLIESLESSIIESKSPMEVDYDIYAAGEAELGWLNCTATMSTSGDASPPISLDALAVDIVHELRERLVATSAEPAHLKVMAQGDGSTAVANCVGSEVEPELSLPSLASAAEVDIILNARAAVDPDRLQSAVIDLLQSIARQGNFDCTIDNLQCFRPARPQPTHRVG